MTCLVECTRFVCITAVVVATLAALPAAVPGSAQAVAAQPGKRLFALRAPRDRQFVHDRAGVWVRAELKRGVKLRTLLLNGVRRPALTRRLRASAGPLSSGRRLVRVRMDRLKRGRNLVALLVRRRGRQDSEQVLVDRARPVRGLIRRFRVSVRLPRNPQVTLLPDRLRVEVKAWLNGRNVSRAFERGDPLRRRLRLSPKDGLRQGVNRLVVRVRSFDGRFETTRRTFFVSRGRPLADAGPDRRARAGLAVRLNGSRSLPAVGRSRTGLGYRWTVVAKPPGAEPVLSGANRRRAILRTDPTHPGRYVARLRVSSHKGGGVRTTDTTETTADAQPRVPVETIATAGGKHGIALGTTIDCEDATVGAAEPCFYANPGSDDQLQVLVLDRDTLAPPLNYPKYNQAYTTSNLTSFKTQMQALVTGQGGAVCPSYDDRFLVLLVLRSGAVTDTTNFAAGMNVFNVSPSAPNATSTSQCVATRTDPAAGPFSVIGVPGMLTGKAWTNAGLTIGTATGEDGITGSVSGFLKEVDDNPGSETPEITRGFSFPDAIPFQTRAAGASSATTGDDTFVLGSDSVPLLPGTGAVNGISVISFDALNPSGTLTREAFVTNIDGEPTVGMDWDQLNTVLGQLMAGTPPSGHCKVCGVGLVVSGQTGGYEFEPDFTGFQAVLAKLEQLGVNPDTFVRALNSTDTNTPSGHGTYSMIAANGIGFASSNVIADGVSDANQYLQVYDGVLTGVLRRGAAGLLAPAQADPAGLQGPSTMTPILYGAQGDWLLTPALADTTACATDTTGPETGCQATGQEVAFAYVAEQAFANLFPDTPPVLWTGGTATATGTAVPGVALAGSADSLDGDGCVTNEAPAPTSDAAGQGTVVDASSVRSASLVLRNTYASSLTLDPGAPGFVKLPGGAPFTQSDLDCAINQMHDELDARNTVSDLVYRVTDSAAGLGGVIDVDLGQVAEDVQTGAMASISQQISAQQSSAASWWAQMAMQWTPGIARILTFAEDANPFLKDAYEWLQLFGDTGQIAMGTINGPDGNPAALVEQYVLLEAQLQQQEIDVESQVVNAMQAQTNGVLLSREILLSGPTMMAAADHAAGTTYNYGANDANVQIAANNAYLYNVRQLAYQALWPQVYDGVRVSYANTCENTTDGGLSCWNADADTWQSAYSNTATDPSVSTSLTLASQVWCNGFVPGHPFQAARTGSPAGLGEGTEYQPQASVASASAPTQYLDYAMVEASSISASSFSKGLYPTVADMNVVQPFFAQPDDSSQDVDASAAPGFYAPDFWFQNLNPSVRLSCDGYAKSSDPTMDIGSVGAWYDGVDIKQDLWPTPPFNPDEPCTWEPIGTTNRVRAVCVFPGGSRKYTNGTRLNVNAFVPALGGDLGSSGIWIAAYGGSGAGGGTSGGVAVGGSGGAGGYAQTYFDSANSLASELGGSVLYYFNARAGNVGGSVHAAGGGGAATIIGSQDLSAAATAPCVLADSNAVNGGGGTVSVPNLSTTGSSCAKQNVIVVAAGAGGGGEADALSDGGGGGGGGTAIAAGRTVSSVGGTGGGKGGHEGVAGNANGAAQGARGSTDGGGGVGDSGIGGTGGDANDASRVGWSNATPYVGSYGSGGHGSTQNGDGGYGGGGGGGFGGGGGAGLGGSSTGGGGGGGGGSYALKGDKPPSGGAIVSTRPAGAGPFIIVVDDVDGPSPAGGGVSATLGSSRHQARGGSRLRVRFGTTGPATARLVVTGRGVRIAVTRRVKGPGWHRRAIRLVAGGRPLRRGNYRLRLIVTDARGRRATDSARLRVSEAGR